MAWYPYSYPYPFHCTCTHISAQLGTRTRTYRLVLIPGYLLWYPYPYPYLVPNYNSGKIINILCDICEVLCMYVHARINSFMHITNSSIPVRFQSFQCKNTHSLGSVGGGTKLMMSPLFKSRRECVPLFLSHELRPCTFSRTLRVPLIENEEERKKRVPYTQKLILKILFLPITCIYPPSRS